MARVKPSLAASFSRDSLCPTARTSADKPISPKTTVSAGAATPVSEEIKAAATAKSAAGSLIFRPPATFKNTSRPANSRPQRASSTAVTMAKRPVSQPITARRGVPNGDGATNA